MSPRGAKAASHIVTGEVEKVLPNGYEFVVDGEHVKVTSSEFCRGDDEGCVCADHFDIPPVGTPVRLRVGDESGRITKVEEVRSGSSNGHGRAAGPAAVAPGPPARGDEAPDRISRTDLLRARVNVVVAASNFEGTADAIPRRADIMWAWVMKKAQPSPAREARPEAHTRPTAAEAPAEDPNAAEAFWTTVLAAFDGEASMAGAWLAAAMEIKTALPPEQIGLPQLRAWLRGSGHTIAALEARLESDVDVPFS